MAKANSLSETFIPDISGLAKEFKRIMTRDEHRRFMNAIKLTDFRWTNFVIEEACGRLGEANDPLHEAVYDLKKRWRDRIEQEGGVDTVIGLSFRLSREGSWPWWGKRSRSPALIP